MVPGHGAADTFFERHGWRPAEQTSGLGDVRPGFHHVSLMEGLFAAVGFFAEFFFDEVDQHIDADRISSAAEVDDFVARGFQGENGAARDVFDVGEVTALAAIAEEFDGGAFVDPLDEAEDALEGQLWA